MGNKINSMFRLVAILMLLLHVLRGSGLSFTSGGILPFVLYYCTVLLFIFCFAWDTYGHVKKLISSLINNSGK